MLNFAFLLETTTTPAANPLGSLPMIFMIVLLIGMFFFMSRSNKKKEKEAAEMRDNLQVGDEVTTIGGIIGKVVSIKEDTFVLETTKEKTHIRFLKGAIRSVDVRIADVTAANVENKDGEAAPAKKAGFFSFFSKKKAKNEEPKEENKNDEENK